MYCTGLYLHWRIVAWIACAGAFFPVLMTAYWTPESPVWLIHKGQDAKALKSLEYFKNSKYVSYFHVFFLLLNIFVYSCINCIISKLFFIVCWYTRHF